MNAEKANQVSYAVGLITGQLLSTISVFFWNDNGRHDVNAAVLTILSMMFWSYGFVGIFELFKKNNPWYARLGLLYALYGCLGGIAFGFEGLYSVIFEVSDKIGVEAHKRFPMQMNLVLFWSGPAFPLTVLLFGVMFIFRKIGPGWLGVMFILSAIAFPVSRISRNENIAHLSDLLLLISLVILSVNFLTDKKLNEIRQGA